MKKNALIALTALSQAISTTVVATAAGSSDGCAAAARLAAEADAYRNAGDLVKAESRLRLAFNTCPVAPLALDLAEVLQRQGKTDEAVRLAREASDWPAGPDEDRMIPLREKARGLLKQWAPSAPAPTVTPTARALLQISVDGPPADTVVTVTIDGRAGTVRVGNPLPSPQQPGIHTIRVEAAGYQTFETSVSARAGESLPLAVKLLSTAAPVPVDPGASRLTYAGWSSIGAATISGALAIGFCADYILAYQQIGAMCPGDRCPKGVEPPFARQDQSRDFAAGFGSAAALGLAFGLVSLWLGGRTAPAAAVAATFSPGAARAGLRFEF